MSCRVNIFGDLCPQGISPSFPFSPDLEREMATAFNVVNLECPITTSLTQRPLQAKNLKATPEAMGIVSRFQAVSLANNHIRDYQDSGCIDTLKALEDARVAHFGLGRTQQEAIQALTTQWRGIPLAFIGATRYANSKRGAWGTASDNTHLLTQAVRKCHDGGFFTIVYLHAGYEYVPLPAPRERGVARRCIRSGADLVAMSHPHVMQGIETFEGKTIAYSLGNFIFPSSIMDEMSACPGNGRLFQSLYLALDIAENRKYSVEFKGYRFDDAGIECLDGAGNEELHEELARISAPLRTRYFTYWKAYYRQAIAICGQNRKIRNQFQKIGQLPLKKRPQVLFDFNAQDLKNRLACLVPGLFR